MKQITKKQMQELKGQLNDMDYNQANLINMTVIVTTDTQNDSVCKAKNIVGDAD
jgi:hypothetical protein